MADDPCERCKHPFGPHVVIATSESIMDGGIVLCPVQGCGCLSTWDVAGRRVIRQPDTIETAQLRADVQSGRPPRIKQWLVSDE